VVATSDSATAAAGDVVYEGLLLNLLRAFGSIEEFRELLADLSTRVIEPQPGERFQPTQGISNVSRELVN